MKRRASQLLSILLVLCMLLGLLPCMAFAADGNHPFTDVSDTAWYSDAVQYVYEHNMMVGTSSTKFSPDSPTSRGMIVTILHRLEGLPTATGTAFTDIPSGQWYAEAVAWASANNIVSGYGNGKFGPDDPITREQMAAILYRYAQYKEYDTTIAGSAANFSDGEQVSSYAVDAVNWAIGVGLLQGVGNNMLSPASGANRAQAATMLMRFCENVATQETTPDIEISEDEIYTKTPDESHIKEGTYELDGESTDGLYVDNQIVVVAEDGVNYSQIEVLVRQYEGTIVGQIGAIGYYQIEFANSMTGVELSEIARKVLGSTLVEDAFINFVLEYANQWQEWEQAYIPDDYDDTIEQSAYDDKVEFLLASSNTKYLSACNVPQAWWLTRQHDPNVSIKMGLIDDAIAAHEDLNLTFGYSRYKKYHPSFVASDAPLSSSKHGTHVAGIMGAKGDNGYGISGVALNAELISVSRRITDNEEGYLTDFASNAADYGYLIQKGCKVINVSLGFKDAEDDTYAEEEARKLKYELLQYAEKGYQFVIVVAAGNDGTNPKHNTLFASGLAYITDQWLKDRIIVVGNAMITSAEPNESGGYTYKAMRAPESNYIGGRVDVMAPGSAIYSTISYVDGASSSDRYNFSSGTSMAAPFVAGLAGLLWENNPNLTPKQIKSIIIETADIDVVNSDANMVNAEAAVARVLGHSTFSLTPRQVKIQFFDTESHQGINSSTVQWLCKDYQGHNPVCKSTWNGEYTNESGTIEILELLLPIGEFDMTFSAPGYQDETISVNIFADRENLEVYMTPTDETPPPAEGCNNLRLEFVSADTGLPIPLVDIFHDTATIGVGRSTTDDSSPEITFSVYQSASPSDTEILLKNVPQLELREWSGQMQPWGNYQLYFDYSEVLYELPGSPDYPYTIAELELKQNELGEYVVTFSLAKHYVKVESVAVTEDNATDVLGDGTVMYDYSTKTLTLANATLCENGILPKVAAVASNMRDLTINIPNGTTSYMYSTQASAIDSKGIHIKGGGTLHIASDGDYYAITNSKNETRDVYIQNTTVIFDDSSGGITCDNFIVDQANVSNIGVYGYEEFVRANAITIDGSTVDITSIGSKILWSRGGDITISNSDITLYNVDNSMNYGYLLFAEMASIYIDDASKVDIVAPYIGTTEDHDLLYATKGIILGEGLIIRDKDGKTCEIYQPSVGDNYSVRCSDGTYPNQIFIAVPSLPVPAIRSISVPERIIINDIDYTWYAYVSGGGTFTLDGSFTLFGDYRPIVTTTWGDSVTLVNTTGQTYTFSIDLWNTWYNSNREDGSTLGKIIINAGDETNEITVVIESTFSVLFH